MLDRTVQKWINNARCDESNEMCSVSFDGDLPPSLFFFKGNAACFSCRRRCVSAAAADVTEVAYPDPRISQKWVRASETLAAKQQCMYLCM